MLTPPLLRRYAFRALIPPQVYCSGSGCPTLDASARGGSTNESVYTYTSGLYQVYEEETRRSLGYLVIFILVFQAGAFLAVRYIRHIVR